MVRLLLVLAGSLATLVLGLGAAAGATDVAQSASAPTGGVDGPLQRPVNGAVITQGFGCTAFAAEPVDLACPQRHFHSGVDLAAPLGTPVRAANAGVVHTVRSPTGYGLHIYVTAPNGGLRTLYGHLSGFNAGEGDVVAAGEVIGALGSTGNSTGPHLHFEVQRGDVAEDPLVEVALP